MRSIKNSKKDLAHFGGAKVFKDVKTTMNLPAPKFHDFQTKWLGYINGGDPVRDFEIELGKFHEVDEVVSFCSCFNAMALALRAIALPGRREVILPAFTYRRMSDIVVWGGFTPCFCDNDPDTLGVNADVIERMISSQTAAILGAPSAGKSFID